MSMTGDEPTGHVDEMAVDTYNAAIDTYDAAIDAAGEAYRAALDTKEKA